MPEFHAYFENMSEAGKTLKTLKNMGFVNAHLDMAGAFDCEFSDETSTPDTQSALSLSALIMRNGESLYDTKKTPLIEANSADGSAGPVETGRAISTRLCINVQETDVENVCSIIKKNGGRIFTTFIE